MTLFISVLLEPGVGISEIKIRYQELNKWSTRGIYVLFSVVFLYYIFEKREVTF